MGPVVRAIGTGIGFLREKTSSQNQRRSSDTSNQSQAEPQKHQGFSINNTGHLGSNSQSCSAPVAPIECEPDEEEEWWLDDLVQDDDLPQLEHQTASRSQYSQDERIVFYRDQLVNRQALVRLPCPVILPQRRPRDRTRGFVRAYALVLQNAGIDQSTWLRVMDDFHESSKANPIFMTINLAAFGAGFTPIPAVIAVTIAVQFAAETARQLQTIQRTNNFLDKMNQDFFVPRGLFAMVMTYQPYATKGITVDISKPIAKRLEKPNTEGGKIRRKLQEFSGKVNAVEFPEAAPLIFPKVEKMLEDDIQRSSIIKKLRDHESFSVYLDKRSQAKYAYENPTSTLSDPNALNCQFASRYSNPNHPASNGSLISLLTGGHINPRAGVNKLRQMYRDHQRDKLNEKLQAEGSEHRVPDIKVSNSIDIWKKVLRQNVLYFMVVNMPTKEELAEAQKELVEAEKMTDWEDVNQ